MTNPSEQESLLRNCICSIAAMHGLLPCPGPRVSDWRLSSLEPSGENRGSQATLATDLRPGPRFSTRRCFGGVDLKMMVDLFPFFRRKIFQSIYEIRFVARVGSVQ